MARYIDAIKLSRDFAASALRLNCNGTMERIVNIICKMVMDEPEADVAEVKHGEWKSEWSRLANALYYHCSFCGESDPWQHKGRGRANYCPNCGAKMDGGKAE